MVNLVNVIITDGADGFCAKWGWSMKIPSRIKNYRNLLGLILQLPNRGRLCWRLWRDCRVPKYLKGMVIATLLYVLSPVDLIPELFVPFVGQLDDATLLLLASYVLIRWSPQEVVSEHRAPISTNVGGRLRPWLS
jgi:uncharacterized membrane protein YkvA (DUF1232 family)